jgi:hypothetical protein
MPEEEVNSIWKQEFELLAVFLERFTSTKVLGCCATTDLETRKVERR